jgi:hypothetical protein
MAGRKLEDWLDAYVQYAKDSEPPRIFHPWIGISMLAGALGRKVHTNLGFETLYPNLYIILLAPSGCRKGTAITIGRQIMTPIAGIKIGAQATTREMLIKDMADSMVSYEDEDGIAFHSSFTQIAGELHVFLRKQNVELLADLCSWYDCESPWEYRTKHEGIDTINGICLNILGATAPEYMPDMFPAAAIGGGATARMIFIVAYTLSQLVPEQVLTEGQIKLGQTLVNDLEQINMIAGEYTKTREAQDYYNIWYTKQGENPPLKDPRFLRYCARRGATIHKLSMVCAASRHSKTEIELQDLQRAIKLLELAEMKMERAFEGVGESKFVYEMMLIMRYFEAHGRATDRELMEALFRDVDAWTMNIVLKTLVLMGKIKVEETLESGITVYNVLEIEGGEKDE